MFNPKKSVWAAVLCGGALIGAAGISQASQQCDKQASFTATAACSTANGKVSAFAAGASNGTLTTNLTKGVDTGVAATRDSASAAGRNNANLIVCAASDFNPSPNVFKTVSGCAGSTIVTLSAVDNP